MPATQPTGPYGSEHYRQLLEQPEDDEVGKLRRSVGTLVKIHNARMSWEKFCREVLGTNVDPVERLRKFRLRDVQVYMRWLLDASDIRKLSAMVERMKIWLMMYNDAVGHPLNANLKGQMNVTTLKDDFNLDPTKSTKESINVDDFHQLLKRLWTRDTYIYPVERQRVQQALITLLIALTGARLGAIVESSSYRKSNEALLYKHVALRLGRDPAEPRQTVLLMEVTVTLWKGEREKMKP